jgi:hypothetical protein
MGLDGRASCARSDQRINEERRADDKANQPSRDHITSANGGIGMVVQGSPQFVFSLSNPLVASRLPFASLNLTEAQLDLFFGTGNVGPCAAALGARKKSLSAQNKSRGDRV